MGAEQPIIEVQNLKKYFPVTAGILRRIVAWVKAVDNISFQIQTGQTFGLVGESGCGKTTSAKVLLQLEKPTAGKVLWKGADLFHPDAGHRKKDRGKIQAVFQDPMSSMNPRMRSQEIIAEPLIVNRRVSKREALSRVSELLLEVGLKPEDGRKYPHEFSGGQRQRIAVARALALNPSVILLDEPVSSLDMSVRAQIMNLLKDLQKLHGLSYLLIAHDIGTMRYMSQTAAVMYLGQIVEEAPSGDICSKAFHPYTQGLIAAAAPARPSEDFKPRILGEVPSPVDPPPGCRFHTRCHVMLESCKQITPLMQEIHPGHKVACHLYDNNKGDQAHTVRKHILDSFQNISE